jgi:NADPH2:quinone reductase
MPVNAHAAHAAHAVRLDRAGGPETLTLSEVAVGEPGAGEIRIRHHAIGINYIDVYHRSGAYPLPAPFGIGVEGAGVVEAVGEGVSHLRAGDRAAYVSQPPGAYATLRVMPAKCVVKLPDAIGFDEGAAMMLKGFTTQYLLRRTLPQGGLAAGDFVLFHAAAGGVGLIACQWARALGLQLIGTASTDEKCAAAKAHGAAFTINYARDDFAARVREITGGKGVPVVYDSIGKDTFLAGLDCLQPRGIMVTYGNASGPVDPFSPSILASKGSLFVTRPTLAHYTSTAAELQACADDLFAVIASGAVKVAINQRFALKDAAKAHDALTSKQTTGATILIP